MRIVGPPSSPRDREVRRVVTLIRTDLSGASLVRDHEAIEKVCRESDYRIVAALEGNAQRFPYPGNAAALAVSYHDAQAVIVPSADHLGTGLDLVSRGALVIPLDVPGQAWADGVRMPWPS